MNTTSQAQIWQCRGGLDAGKPDARMQGEECAATRSAAPATLTACLRQVREIKANQRAFMADVAIGEANECYLLSMCYAVVIGSEGSATR